MDSFTKVMVSVYYGKSSASTCMNAKRAHVLTVTMLDIKSFRNVETRDVPCPSSTFSVRCNPIPPASAPAFSQLKGGWGVAAFRLTQVADYDHCSGRNETGNDESIVSTEC